VSNGPATPNDLFRDWSGDLVVCGEADRNSVGTGEDSRSPDFGLALIGKPCRDVWAVIAAGAADRTSGVGALFWLLYGWKSYPKFGFSCSLVLNCASVPKILAFEELAATTCPAALNTCREGSGYARTCGPGELERGLILTELVAQDSWVMTSGGTTSEPFRLVSRDWGTGDPTGFRGTGGGDDDTGMADVIDSAVDVCLIAVSGNGPGDLLTARILNWVGWIGGTGSSSAAA